MFHSCGAHATLLSKEYRIEISPGVSEQSLIVRRLYLEFVPRATPYIPTTFHCGACETEFPVEELRLSCGRCMQTFPVGELNMAQETTGALCASCLEELRAGGLVTRPVISALAVYSKYRIK